MSGVLFMLGGFAFAVASFLIVFIPGALRPLSTSLDAESSAVSRTDRVAGMVFGSIGGSLLGLVAFVCLLALQGSIDVALFAFHAVLIASAVLAYCYPKPVSDISLALVDGIMQLIDGIFG